MRWLYRFLFAPRHRWRFVTSGGGVITATATGWFKSHELWEEHERLLVIARTHGWTMVSIPDAVRGMYGDF